jgi:hypothetical protein
MTSWHLDIPHYKRPFCGMDVLFYYDGPLLFWMPCEGRRLLTVALPDEVGPWPFLVVEMTEEAAQALEGNRLTLRAAVLAGMTRWLLTDYGAEILEFQPLQAIPEDWLPGDVCLRSEPENQGAQA